MKQKEAEAASATQERDALRNKLKMLQDQILRGDQATARQAALQKVRKVHCCELVWAAGQQGLLSTFYLYV
jgi:hypothetical protein